MQILAHVQTLSKISRSERIDVGKPLYLPFQLSSSIMSLAESASVIDGAFQDIPIMSVC